MRPFGMISLMAINTTTNHYEEWRTVPGYDGRLQASTLGRIRDSRYPNQSYRPQYPFNPNRDGKPYFLCSFNNPPKQTRCAVHRLVAAAFLGEPLGKRRCVNHKDSNPSNNRPENLEWVTPAENTAHAKAAGRLRHGLNRGDSNGNNDLSVSSVLKIRRLRDAGHSLSSIARLFGIDPSTVSLIGRRLRWSYVPEEPKPEPRKLTYEDMEVIRARRSGGETLTKIGDDYGLHFSAVSRLCNSKQSPLPAAI